jgi:hypothetical protein
LEESKYFWKRGKFSGREESILEAIQFATEEVDTLCHHTFQMTVVIMPVMYCGAWLAHRHKIFLT